MRIVSAFHFFYCQKKQLSAQSLAFNLKDRIFCELFPEVVEVIHKKSNLSSLCLYNYIYIKELFYTF